MIRVGEATGQLDVALGNVSDFYTREVHEAINRIQAVLPVIMTIVLGAMIGMVMLAVLGPLYDTIGGLQP
jgi:type IV pilus assembly protein PilC